MWRSHGCRIIIALPVVRLQNQKLQVEVLIRFETDPPSDRFDCQVFCRHVIWQTEREWGDSDRDVWRWYLLTSNPVSAGRGVDLWVRQKGARCGRYSRSPVQGGEGGRRVTSGPVQGEEGEASVIEHLIFHGLGRHATLYTYLKFIHMSPRSRSCISMLLRA